MFIIGQQTQDLSSEDWGLNDNCAEMNGTPMAYMCQCCALAEWLLQKVYRPTIVGLAGVPWGRFLLLPVVDQFGLHFSPKLDCRVRVIHLHIYPPQELSRPDRPLQ